MAREAWARYKVDELAADRIAEPPPKGAGLYVVPGGLSASQPRRRRVYVDTSVFGGCLEDKFREGSQALIDAAKRGDVTLVVSDLVRKELEPAPQAVQDILKERSLSGKLETVAATKEADRLADAYIDEGVLTEKSRNDATHIAIAAIHRVDALVSWNRRHMTRPERVLGYNAINRRLGYPKVSIHEPQRRCSVMAKKFDTLKWVREIRDRHYEETKHMTPDERLAHIRAGARRFDEMMAKQGAPWAIEALRKTAPDGTPLASPDEAAAENPDAPAAADSAPARSAGSAGR